MNFKITYCIMSGFGILLPFYGAGIEVSSASYLMNLYGNTSTPFSSSPGLFRSSSDIALA